MKTDIEKGKTAAITSYILLVGIPIAMSMNSEEEKSEFASFHIRQSIGITLTFMSLAMVLRHFNSLMVIFPMWIFISVLWSYGIFSAINGSTKPMPLVGNFYQKFLKGIS